MSNQVVTLGADPEFFVGAFNKAPAATKNLGPNPFREGSASHKRFEENQQKTESKLQFLPITGLLGGTKQSPVPMRPGNVNWKQYLMQEDGAAVEFNVPPATTSTSFGNSINTAVRELEAILKRKELLPLKDVRSVTLSKEHLEKFPSLNIIGCDPDICAYSGDQKPRIIPDLGLNRGCGGHIHVGYDKELVPPQILAKLLDITLSLPTLKHDKQGWRRHVYGVPGLYRDKPYGVEYRPLSSFWIWNDALCLNMSSTVFLLMKSVQSNLIEWQAFFNTIPWHAVQTAILGENIEHADKLVKTFCENKLYKAVVSNVL